LSRYLTVRLPYLAAAVYLPCQWLPNPVINKLLRLLIRCLFCPQCTLTISSLSRCLVFAPRPTTNVLHQLSMSLGIPYDRLKPAALYN